MAVQTIHINETFNAPLERVFDFFGTHSNLPVLFGGKFERVKDATAGDNPNGLGSVRSIRVGGGPAFEETITAFDPPHRIEYTITKGSPVKNHHGVMLFSGDDNTATLDYTIQLEGKLPGSTCLIVTVMRMTLARGMGRVRKVLEG